MPGALFTGLKGSLLLSKNKPLAAGAYAAYQIHVLRGFILILIVTFSAGAVWAGGSGLNVVVVVNQNSPESLQLGNDYCQKRGVPPQNVFRMTGWTGGAIYWSRTQCEQYLRGPLLSMLAQSGLSNQVQYVLLSMDIPLALIEGENGNSTTSFLFYGFKTNSFVPPGVPVSCSLPDYSSNSYAFIEAPFEQAKPDTADTNSFLAFMLTDNSLPGAEAILERGVAADASFPTQTVYLEKTSDPARSVRFLSFDNAIFDSRIRSDNSVVRINSDFTGFENIRGLSTGFSNLILPTNAFVPGTIGDSLTSYAGILFGPNDQTSLLVFLNGGAAASYGTVIEPCSYLQKFPDPLVYFYQRRGFSAAEAYYLSILNPYQGLLVGEPLCAPFALPGQVQWPGLTNGSVLTGLASLPSATFFAASGSAPLDQEDLFVDGRFLQTLTNVAPASGNVISVSLNGSSVQYTVPQKGTLRSVTAGLAEALNNQSNATRVAAFPTADRIELQGLDVATPGSSLPVTVSGSAGAAGALTILASVAQPGFLDTMATGYLGFTVTNSMKQGDWLQLQITKTNGSKISLSVTNNSIDTNVTDLCQLLMNAVNAEPALQGNDGVLAADLFPDVESAAFLLYARTAGWPASQIVARLASSADLIVIPDGELPLQDNLTDLRPRNHLYLTSGLQQLSSPSSFDTTRFADGYHELTLVAYEGTAMRTQTHISRTVRVQNTGLNATLSPNFGGTNVAPDAALSFTVSANSSSIDRIELFSTGGAIGVVSNQASVTFNVPASSLGAGSHPFYALVTDTLGHQYQTDPLNIRIIPAIQLSISSQPFVLSWLTAPGVVYDILSSTNLASGFQKVAMVTASGPVIQWPVPNSSGSANFFRVQAQL